MAGRREQRDQEIGRTRFLDLGDSPEAGRRGNPSAHTRAASGSRRARGAAYAGDAGGANAGRPRRGRTSSQVAGNTERAGAWYRPTIGKVILIVAALVAIVFGVRLCTTATPINVTVNGSHYELRGNKTLQVALKESGLPINPGDLISLQGNVIERSAGDPFFATVNDVETADPEYKLRDGDVITLADGKDVVEPYDAVESPVAHSTSIVGVGAIHTFSEGADGVMETRTGRISGEVVDKQVVDPIDLVETRYNPDVGDRKVIALTFDDGPSGAYTEDILDILAQSGAKATFFCRGERISTGGDDIVRRAAAEGHQICTHSYDNAAMTGGNMANLMPEELVDQVEKGLAAIADALGTEPSRKVRIGSEDLPESAVPIVAPLIEAEIGWTLDTGDWIYVGEDEIYGVLMSAKPGDVVRMHDGGDHQDDTVAALKRALPKLVAKGYQFVTIDEFIG